MQFLVIGSVTNPHRVGDVGDKFSTRPSELNLLGWYEPGGRWQFSWTFCGKDWFTHMKSMTFGEIVDAVRIKPIAGG
jgi:hypothetical protein